MNILSTGSGGSAAFFERPVALISGGWVLATTEGVFETVLEVVGAAGIAEYLGGYNSATPTVRITVDGAVIYEGRMGAQMSKTLVDMPIFALESAREGDSSGNKFSAFAPLSFEESIKIEMSSSLEELGYLLRVYK